MAIDERGLSTHNHRLLIVGRPSRLSRIIRRSLMYYPSNVSWYLISDGATCLYDGNGRTRFWDIPDSLDINVPDAATAELEKQ